MPLDGPDGRDTFVIGEAPFWPVDHLAVPDAWAGHIPFAFWIVEAHRPRLLVELGTHSGNSYLAFVQAVHRLGLGTACFAIDTWQGDPHAGQYGEEVFQDLARYHDARYGAFSRLVRSTFDEAVQHFPDAAIDLLHVDGYHTYDAVARDFATWGPKLSRRAVILFHDINVREGDFGAWRLWEELRQRHPHFEFLHSHGLGVLGVGADLPAAVTALLQATPDAAMVSRIRQVFARLGHSVTERVHFQVRHDAMQHEVDRLAEALRIADQRAVAGEELMQRGAALEEAIHGLRQQNDEQRRLIHELRRGSEDHRQLIGNLQHEIVRLGTSAEAERARWQEQLQRAEREGEEATRRAEGLDAALTALHQSRSVRLTRPLRLAGDWYRSVAARARRGAGGYGAADRR